MVVNTDQGLYTASPSALTYAQWFWLNKWVCGDNAAVQTDCVWMATSICSDLKTHHSTWPLRVYVSEWAWLFVFMFFFFSFRFHVCAQSLPFGQTVAKNPVYFLQMIWDMAEYTNYLIRLCNKGKIHTHTQTQP